jgi:hypothetical protein
MYRACLPTYFSKLYFVDIEIAKLKIRGTEGSIQYGGESNGLYALRTIFGPQ